MACMSPAELPAESRFLLESDGIKKKSKKTFAYHDITYWLGATRAVKKAGRIITSAGRRKIKTMTKLKI